MTTNKTCTLFFVVVTALATGCDYIRGAELMRLNDMYCSDLSTDYREKLIEKIRKKFPTYPADGICGIERDLKNGKIFDSSES